MSGPASARYAKGRPLNRCSVLEGCLSGSYPRLDLGDSTPPRHPKRHPVQACRRLPLCVVAVLAVDRFQTKWTARVMEVQSTG
jgi:hypothetical protein